MNAAVVEKPGKICVKDIPIPVPGDYEALCKIVCCATCAGTDLHIINGTFPFPINYPTILGHESIGYVIKVGKKVRYYKKGDMVTKIGAKPVDGYDSSYGGFAEYGIAKDHKAMCEDHLPQDEWFWSRAHQVVPDDIDPMDATMIITWRETLSYITRMGKIEGNRVLILGSGGNGLSFAANAINKGADAVVMLGSIQRRSAATLLGLHGYYEYKDKDWVLTIKKTYGLFDIIIDSLGKVELSNNAVKLIKPGGTIGIYGLDEMGHEGFESLSTNSSYNLYKGSYDEEEVHEEVIKRMRDGSLRAEMWIEKNHSYNLAEITEAFEDVRDRKHIKAIIKCTC